MISKQILRSSLTLSRFLPRFSSKLSKDSSSNKNKSTNKKKSASEYLADDMYNYTTFSYYDIELSMTKYRLPQPSPSKPEPVPQKK